MGSNSEDRVTRRHGTSRRVTEETGTGPMNVASLSNSSTSGQTGSLWTRPRSRKKSTSPRRSKSWRNFLPPFLRDCFYGDTTNAFACFSCVVILVLLAMAVLCYVQLASLSTEEKHFAYHSAIDRISRRHTRSEKAKKKTKSPSFLGPKFEITFIEPLSQIQMEIPDELGPFEAAEGDYASYGHLHHLEFFDEDGARRYIYKDMHQFETDFREPFLPQDDDQDGYYAFDDDAIRSSHGVIVGDAILEGKLCRRTAEHRNNRQNCNLFHELPFLDSHARTLGHGAFRQVFGLTRSYGNLVEEIAVKDIKYDRSINNHDLEYTRVDANVAEVLSASPRIYDIYGHCGIAIASEWFPHGDLEEAAIDYDDYPEHHVIEENEKKEELVVYNNITSREKLRICLHMSEALADLHGYKNGVIVHQDVQLSQFLLNKDFTRIKLNDFNRAEFMLWDEEAQEYCLYSSGAAHGNWRSAEEYYERNHNEQIDVFSLANNMYGILTGLEPFYDEGDDYDNVKIRVKKGDKAYIDPRFKERSLAEAKVAEIIDRCHELDPSVRPTIFEVVEFLRAALEEVKAADRNKESRT